MSKKKQPKQAAPKAQQIVKNVPSRPVTSSKAPSPASTVEWPWILAALVLTIVAFTYALKAGWTNWDDEVNVLSNDLVKNLNADGIRQIFTTHIIGGYNPLTILSFAIDWHLFNDDPFPYHLINLLLHLGCVFFAFRLSRHLRLTIGLAFIVACLFGFQPMRVESVAWITERKDVLYGVFFLWALAIYARHGLRSTSLNALMVALAILACLSKIQAVTLPLSMLAIDYLKDGKWTWRQVINKWPFFLISLATGLVGIYFLTDQGSLHVTSSATNYTPIHRLLLGMFTYVVFAVKAVVPFRMSPLYPYPPSLPVEVYLCAALLVVAGVTLYLNRRKLTPSVIFGLTFFTVNVVFMLQIVGAGQGYLADRFTYIAYYGLFFMMAYGIGHWRTAVGSATVPVGLTGVVLCIYFGMTFQQNKIWTDSETLWTHVLRYYPNTSLPHWNRANHRRDIGNAEGAMHDYNNGIRLEPQKADLYNSRARLHFDAGHFQEALKDYQLSISIDSSKGEYFVNYASSLASLGNYPEAMSMVRKGLLRTPDALNGHKTKFILHLSMNQPDSALVEAEKLIALGNREGDMYFERAMIYRQRQQWDLALADLNFSIQLGGKNLKIYLNARSDIHRVLGNTDAANADAAQAAGM